MTKSSKWSALFNLTMIILVALTVEAFIASTSTKARPAYVKDLPSSLKNYCNVCHTAPSGGPLNVYGEDYVRFGMNVSATGSLDSDGDGFTNEEEFTAGTFPGDPDSYPGSSSGSIPTLEIIAVATASSFVVVFILWVYRRKMKESRLGASVSSKLAVLTRHL